MSTTTTPTTRDERPRAGASETTRTDPDRWSAGAASASEHAPRQFDPACGHRLPNTCDDANKRV